MDIICEGIFIYTAEKYCFWTITIDVLILSFEFKISVIRAVRSDRWLHAKNWSATPTSEASRQQMKCDPNILDD